MKFARWLLISLGILVVLTGALFALALQPSVQRWAALRATADVPTTSAESIALSKALKKAGFAFVGPTTMHALMEAIGLVDDHLEGCHRRGCAD